MMRLWGRPSTGDVSVGRRPHRIKQRNEEKEQEKSGERKREGNLKGNRRLWAALLALGRQEERESWGGGGPSLCEKCSVLILLEG